MDINFSSDKPISSSQDDKFQRYDFAKRIANTIVERKNEDCVVIGVYGAWGEGKTSVVNFIESELQKKKKIITLKFNPWRYADENSLLIQFFEKLATSLDKNLKTKKEKAGDLLKKYGKLLAFDVPIVGNVGEKLENAGEIFGGSDVEELKERIETILKETESKVVIFIDDIDRLDKAEIHSIFRLVKLTADFSNTTYILSFDEEMVSAAIGERFGSGNQRSGQNFLEKIIQVPLKIPVAQPESLKKFCFELIDKALNSNNIKLSEEEIRRFVSEFTGNVLVKLETPRLAVRYSNTLSFSIPLLYGEVNTVDLMLIEAIKTFFPEHYQFIKTNPEYFIGTYMSAIRGHGRDSDKIQSLKAHLDELGKHFTNKQKKCIQDLLEELFPRLNEAFHNYAFNQSSADKWYKEKRIVSSQYFNRYFSYAVIKGELSDVSFQLFLSSISELTYKEVSNSIQKLIRQSSVENFLLKLRSSEDDFNWPDTIKIVKAISILGELLPENTGNYFMSFQAPREQAAILVYQMIKKHKNKSEQFDVAKEIMLSAEPFGFAYTINNWIRRGKTIEEKIFTQEQYSELAASLLERALKESGKTPLFDKFPDQAYFLFKAWNEKNQKELSNYITIIMEKTPKKCLDLLRAMTPTALSTAVVGPYKTDFTREEYQGFISIFDKKYINSIIDKAISKKEILAEEVKWTQMEKVQTDLNIVRQFKHWYNEDAAKA